eukprot:gnl/TRDRNA2_/TRDRNA2_152124_c0_seq1.p1 gnl/TRDRNA2_/TRDRNA2_152124_c0~~gnl/TRDRNA2_/TRDRNA2_152124_c0_seq1.p1  ORF type:complete len:389 (-),score=71.09 gnl/TRDRNA2_/TRDRNA2_152124_c0_seq1:96-1187(-)
MGAWDTGDDIPGEEMGGFDNRRMAAEEPYYDDEMSEVPSLGDESMLDEGSVGGPVRGDRGANFGSRYPGGDSRYATGGGAGVMGAPRQARPFSDDEVPDDDYVAHMRRVQAIDEQARQRRGEMSATMSTTQSQPRWGGDVGMSAMSTAATRPLSSPRFEGAGLDSRLIEATKAALGAPRAMDFDETTFKIVERLAAAQLAELAHAMWSQGPLPIPSERDPATDEVAEPSETGSVIAEKAKKGPPPQGQVLMDLIGKFHGELNSVSDLRMQVSATTRQKTGTPKPKGFGATTAIEDSGATAANAIVAIAKPAGAPAAVAKSGAQGGKGAAKGAAKPKSPPKNQELGAPVTRQQTISNPLSDGHL